MTIAHSLYYILTKYSVTIRLYCCLYKITCYIGYYLSFLSIFKYPHPLETDIFFKQPPFSILNFGGTPQFLISPPKQVFVNAPL